MAASSRRRARTAASSGRMLRYRIEVRSALSVERARRSLGAGDRPARCYRAACGRRQRSAVQKGSRHGGLARLGSAATFDRRKNPDAWHKQARQPLCPPAADSRSTILRRTSRSKTTSVRNVDRDTAIAYARQQGHCGSRGKDRSHGLGDYQSTRGSLRTSRSGDRLTRWSEWTARLEER
jgi:hypothetical protein